MDEDGYCTIACKNSGKVLDVAGASKSSGTNVQQYTPNGTAAQKWRVVDNGDGTFTLESALGEGFVLDIAGAQDANGANVQIWSSNGSDAQRFVFVSANPNTEGGESIAEGLYFLRNAKSSKMADISAASLENGAKAQLYDENKTLAQMVQLVDSGDGFYTVRFVHSGMVLDSDNGNLLPGFRVQQWEGYGIPNQQWAFRNLCDGSYSVVCRTSGLALEARGGGVVSGTELQTSVLDGSDAQAWSLEPVETILTDGYYDIRANGGSRLVVDVSGASAEDGANVQIWSWNGSPAQRFKLVDEDGDGSFTLEALCSGLLLTQKGSNVVQAKSEEGDSLSQLWRAVPAAAGGICFVNEGSGLALDIAEADVDRNGCNVGAYQVNGTIAQSFTAEQTGVISDGTYLIRCAADRRVLDVASGSRSDGANVQAWTENGTGAQAWNLRGVGGGWFVIENARSKKALDVTSYGTAPGTNVQQWASSGNDAQKWLIGYEGNGRYSITTACGNLALDVQGTGGYDGANVQTYTSNGTNAQRFIFEVNSYKPRDLEDCIASFSTVSTYTFNGTHNMQRALNAFNNVIIWPGQTLSLF